MSLLGFTCRRCFICLLFFFFYFLCVRWCVTSRGMNVALWSILESVFYILVPFAALVVISFTEVVLSHILMWVLELQIQSHSRVRVGASHRSLLVCDEADTTPVPSAASCLQKYSFSLFNSKKKKNSKVLFSLFFFPPSVFFFFPG